MATNQNEEFVGDYSTNIYKNQNTCSEIAIKTYFQFSHYKSMDILSCHNNESTWAMAIKNTVFLEANVMNISAKFQLHAPYDLWWDDFLIFFRKFIFSVAMATNQIQQWH